MARGQGQTDPRARLHAAWNESRRSLERQLHDGPQQHIVAFAVRLGLIEQLIDDSPERAKELLRELRSDTVGAVTQLRDLATSVYPPLLAERGLAYALSARAGEGEGVVVDVEVTERHDADVEAAVYFACLDAMSDAGSGAAVCVKVRDGLSVEVRGAVRPATRALIEDRIAAVGGSVVPRPDGGFEATVS